VRPDPITAERLRLSARAASRLRKQNTRGRFRCAGPKTEAEYRAQALKARALHSFCRVRGCSVSADIDGICPSHRKQREAAARKVKTEVRVCGQPIRGVDAYGDPRTCRAIVPCRWHPERLS
jgi:hypothetical protein